jgi:methylenetetrahydrofolate dehydrogenase (NADP+) / methenyltetrahydrofolate cyclohydrolase
VTETCISVKMTVMEEIFEGRKIRDDILRKLSSQVIQMKRKPAMAVFLIGDNPICKKYVALKKKLAEKIGIQFCLYKLDRSETIQDALGCLDFLNKDAETDGVMIQIPLPKNFDRQKLIEKIHPDKDIDGLRYCAGISAKFVPPVVLAIAEAIKKSGAIIDSETKIVIVGQGFLVGAPLKKYLTKEYSQAKILSLTEKNDLKKNLIDADIIISATGKSKLIKPEMVKEEVILIDAGTAEENGEFVGDIDPKTFKKASYYTPVPGGIGPVTVAMLFRNLID